MNNEMAYITEVVRKFKMLLRVPMLITTTIVGIRKGSQLLL